MKPPCPHRMLMFWGSHAQENGASCRKCGATWIHRRRYLRTPRGRMKTVTRLVLTARVRIESLPLERVGGIAWSLCALAGVYDLHKRVTRLEERR